MTFTDFLHSFIQCAPSQFAPTITCVNSRTANCTTAANTTGASYFFTVLTYRRQAFLCQEPVREALRAGILAAQAKHPFIIDAWVLMPDHIHTVL